MASDTVVQYVLKVDAAGAQKALESTAKEATQASHSLDRIEQSTKGAVQGLKNVEKQSKNSTKAARDLRRAGRDLDGAFGDLAQGIGVVSPQLGHMLTEISNGASIVEGLGRSFSLFLNPAVALAATVAIGAGIALAVYESEQQAAEQRAKDLAAAIEESNRIIEEQEKIADQARETIADYSQQLNSARIQLQLLTGATTENEQKTLENERAVSDFSKTSTAAFLEERKALEETARQQDKRLEQIRQEIELLKEARRITQTTRDEQRRGPRFESATEEEQGLRSQAAQIQEQRQQTQQLIQANSENLGTVQDQTTEYRQILNQIQEIEIAEQRRRSAEKARQEKLRKEQKNQRDAERERQRALKAQEQIQQILDKAQFTQLDAVGQINANYNKQAEKLFDLAEVSGDIEGANAALVELTKLRNQLLDEEQAKQDEIAAKEAARAQKAADRIRKQGEQRRKEANQLKKETDIIVKSFNSLANITSDLFIKPTGQLEKMLREVDKIANGFKEIRQEGFKGFVQKGLTNAFEKLGDAEGLQAGLSNALQKVSVVASLDPAAIVGLVSPLAGSFIGLVQGIGEQVLEKSPEQIRKEALAQAEAITVGISFLPELLLSIAPQLGLAIAEAFVDGSLLLIIKLVEGIRDAFKFIGGSIGGSRDVTPDGERIGRSRRRNFIRDFLDPRASASFMGGGRFVPSAQGGIRFTGAQDGLAQLHRGEFVVPQSGQRPQQVDRQLNNTTGGGMTININSAVVDRNAVDALVREIEIRFNNQFGTSSSSLFGGR